jgi:branched-chain amino acid aminotransferase
MLNFNGKLIHNSEISGNRGLQYGDAIFETIKVSAGKILFWEDHYFRLMASMRILRMEIPMNFTPEFLEEEIQKTCKGLDENSSAYRIKIIVWRKEGGKYTPATNEVDYLVMAEALENPFYSLSEDAYVVELYKDHFINSGLLSTLKTTNKIINVLGSIYAMENEYDNCFLLNEKKNIIEVLNGNIFVVNGYTIKTPPLSDGCLNGILRKQIIGIINDHPDFIIEEASVSPFELQKADELFITNTIVGIQSITNYRKKEYRDTLAKELIGKLNLMARLR